MDRSVTYFDDVAAINVSLQLMQNRSGVPCPFPVTTQLCGASYGNMWLCEGDAFRSVARCVANSFRGAMGTGSVDTSRTWPPTHGGRKDAATIQRPSRINIFGG